MPTPALITRHIFASPQEANAFGEGLEFAWQGESLSHDIPDDEPCIVITQDIDGEPGHTTVDHRA